MSILEDLGLSEVRAITNNPEKLRQLRARGIIVIEQIPLVVGVGVFNEQYLEAKRDRMGHILPSTPELRGDSELGRSARARQRILETPEGHFA